MCRSVHVCCMTHGREFGARMRDRPHWSVWMGNGNIANEENTVGQPGPFNLTIEARSLGRLFWWLSSYFAHTFRANRLSRSQFYFLDTLVRCLLSLSFFVLRFFFVAIRWHYTGNTDHTSFQYFEPYRNISVFFVIICDSIFRRTIGI